MEPINRHRVEILDQLKDAGDEGDLRGLVEALVHPLAAQMHSHGAGYFYIPVVAQVSGHPSYSAIAQQRSRHGAGLQRLLTLIKANLTDIPEPLILQRFGMALRQVFNELADYQRLNLTGPSVPASGMELFINGLVDAVTAQFAAPLSAATRREFSRKRKKSA
jgi:hypothetical protein